MTGRSGSPAGRRVIFGAFGCSSVMRAEHPDTVLAQRAAAGDAAAFATLYDRHERRAYNLCVRITGSADDAADATQETFLRVLERLPALGDRELNFGSYLLTAARHASYDALARRRRATPSDAIPDSALPSVSAADESALLTAHQEQIRAANEQLPPRQREVLALREVGELSYDEVAEIMGMNRNSVAQLISRARLNLRDALRRGALGSIAAGSPDCEAALPLLALAQDNGLDDAAAADWLATHLAGCATCRVRVEAMEEAGAAYRLWLPLAPALWLRTETAHAALTRASRRRDAASDASRPAGAASDAAAPASPRRDSEIAVGGGAASRRRLGLAAAGAALVVAAGLAAAEIVEAPVRVPRAAVIATPASTPVATPTPMPAPRAVRHRRVKPKPKPKPKPAPVVREIAVVATPAPTAAPTPAPAPATVKPRPKPRRHAVVTEEPELVLPDPEPTPTATPEPPPPPPPEATPDPTPQPPPQPPRRPPPTCAACGITGPPVVP